MMSSQPKLTSLLWEYFTLTDGNKSSCNKYATTLSREGGSGKLKGETAEKLLFMKYNMIEVDMKF